MLIMLIMLVLLVMPMKKILLMLVMKMLNIEDTHLGGGDADGANYQEAGVGDHLLPHPRGYQGQVP